MSRVCAPCGRPVHFLDLAYSSWIVSCELKTWIALYVQTQTSRIY